MNTPIMSGKTNRKTREIEHDKQIADKAGEIWGWETPAGRLRVARRIELLKTLGQIQNQSAVLELGCGTGIFTKGLAQLKINLTSIDLSPELIEIAREKVQSSNVTFLIQDAEKTDFQDRSFDIILGISILHHLKINIILPEIYRLLKPRGKMIFTEPNMLNPQIFLERNVPFIRRMTGTSPDETAFTRWQLNLVLRQAGFKDVKIKPFDFLHPRIPESTVPFVKAMGEICEQLPLIREIAGSLLIYGARGEN